MSKIEERFPSIYEFASEDEDALTGDFLGSLRSTGQVVLDDPETGGAWSWKI